MALLSNLHANSEGEADDLAEANLRGSVSVRWNLSWEPGVAGYRVHYGTESGSYADHIDVGYQVTTQLTGLTPGMTYYSAVTAYNESGQESGYSNEISFTVDPPPAASLDTDGDGLSDLFEAMYGGGADLDPFSDLDSDGIIALVEFAHGLNPNDPMDDPITQPEIVTIDDQGYFCIRYLIDPQALNFVSVIVEQTTGADMNGTWRAGQTVQMSYEPSTEYPNLIEVVERSTSPISAQPTEFFRIRHVAVPAE